MTRSRKTEEQEFIELLTKKGFTEITKEEKRSPEYKDSIERTRKYVLERENKRRAKHGI
jgi:hypothetical protein